MPGFAPAGTPESLDKVGVIKVGQPAAKNVLVLEPGTSAAGAYFVPFAKWVAETLPGWQVWAVVRRESLLEDQSVLNLAKEGKATAQEVFNFYLGWIGHEETITKHVQLNQSADTFADQWGMKVAVEDLHRVIEAAHKLGGQVVLGGHSLGGSVVTAYATWNFGGKPGANGLAGLVYDDGGSSPIPVSEEKAKEELKKLEEGSPWLSFGGIPAPFAGLFVVLGAGATQVEPNGPSLAEGFALLPASLKPPCKATNEAQFGFGVNVETSPASLTAAQAHVGHLVQPAEGLCTWSGEGALTPIHRYAEMFYGEGLIGQDGSEWYFPARLTMDTGAVADGNENPAQKVLGLEATQGHNLPKSLRILAIDSELDKKLITPRASLIAAEVLAEQSGIPKQNLTLLDVEETYAHNDPAGAFPKNVFFEALVPYLEGIAKENAVAEIKNWVVSGSITPKRVKQPITLPAGSTFNGSAEVNSEGVGGVQGNLFVPPFNNTLKFLGLLPTTLGLTVTQVGSIAGKVTQSETAPGQETLTVPVSLKLGVTSLKLLGLSIPTKCATIEPISLNLTDTLSEEELLSKGWTFTGTTSIPFVRCEGGLLGSLFGLVLSGLLTGPENQYSLQVTAPS
jgi:pimeloyl-ACP methyl ester carboxylesterase